MVDYEGCNHRVLAALIWYEHLIADGLDEYLANSIATAWLTWCYDAP